MTDTYIEEKIRERFLTIDTTITSDDGEEIDLLTKNENSNGDVIYTNIQMPNVAFTRPATGLWFEFLPIPTQPTQQELGTSGRNRWTFGLQINICYPKDYGTYDINTAFNAIAGKFKRGDIFDGIRILNTANRSSARAYDDFYSVPVTIIAQADLDN